MNSPPVYPTRLYSTEVGNTRTISYSYMTKKSCILNRSPTLNMGAVLTIMRVLPLGVRESFL